MSAFATELGTVRRLKEAADRLGLVTKRRLHSSGRVTGGGPFTRGHLYHLLSSPVYVGEVTHKATSYPGRHEAIIDQEMFDAAQRQLTDHSSPRRSATNAKAPSLLTGLVHDETGDRLCPTHANKKGRRYRYYISKRLMHPTGSTVDGWRLPARQLEAAVLQIVQDLLKDEIRIIEALNPADPSPDTLRKIIAHARTVADEFKHGTFERQRQLLSALVLQITMQD